MTSQNSHPWPFPGPPPAEISLGLAPPPPNAMSAPGSAVALEPNATPSPAIDVAPPPTNATPAPTVIQAADVIIAPTPPNAAQSAASSSAVPEQREPFSNRSGDNLLDLCESRNWLYFITGGWPKVVCGRLCDRQQDTVTGGIMPYYIESAAALFARLDRYSTVRWEEGKGCPTKLEFFHSLLQNGEQFAWASHLFHWPALPNVLYTNPAPVPINTGRLDEFIGMFDPHTPSDRLLLKAFVLTPFWGGPTRKRPLFIVSTANPEKDGNAGRASGKTTVVQSIGKLAGGCFTLHKESDMNRAVSDLLSPAGMDVRMILFDNVKTLKFSSAYVESLITLEYIDGHVMYVGHGRRPNYITFAMTANEPMLSTDFATRSISLLVNQSKKSADWDDRLERMLSDPQFLGELYADIMWHLQKPGKPFAEDPTERWSLWWREIVSRCCNNVEELYCAREEVKRRRQSADADRSSRELVEEILRHKMTSNGLADPDDVAVYFPTYVLRLMLAEVFGKNCILAEVGQRLKALMSPNLYYSKAGPDGLPRGYWWVGANCDINAERGIGVAFSIDNAEFLRKEPLLDSTAVRNALHKAQGKVDA